MAFPWVLRFSLLTKTKRWFHLTWFIFFPRCRARLNNFELYASVKAKVLQSSRRINTRGVVSMFSCNSSLFKSFELAPGSRVFLPSTPKCGDPLSRYFLSIHRLIFLAARWLGWSYTTGYQSLCRHLQGKIYYIPLSTTISCHVPCGFSPQHRTVENVQSTKPPEDLKKKWQKRKNSKVTTTQKEEGDT